MPSRSLVVEAIVFMRLLGDQRVQTDDNLGSLVHVVTMVPCAAGAGLENEALDWSAELFAREEVALDTQRHSARVGLPRPLASGILDATSSLGSKPQFAVVESLELIVRRLVRRGRRRRDVVVAIGERRHPVVEEGGVVGGQAGGAHCAAGSGAWSCDEELGDDISSSGS